MKLLTKKDISNLRMSRGYTHKGVKFVKMCRSFTEALMNSNQNTIMNKLRLYYNVQIAEREDRKIHFKPIREDWLYKKNISVYYRAENALVCLFAILLKSYDYTIGLTVTKEGDGGFDIAICEKGKDEPALLIDSKSGKNSNNRYVHWFNNDVWLLRAIRDPENRNTNIGECSALENYRTHVADISWLNLFENLAAVLFKDLSNAEIDAKLIELHQEMSQFV